MEVIFSKPAKLGNISYPKGKREIPDDLAHNIAFKHMVKSGLIQVLPKSEAQQKIQSARDVKNLQRAKQIRKEMEAKKEEKPAPVEIAPEEIKEEE